MGFLMTDTSIFLRPKKPGFDRQCPDCGNSEDLMAVFNGCFMVGVEIGGCSCPCGYRWTEHIYPGGDVFLAGGYHPGVYMNQVFVVEDRIRWYLTSCDAIPDHCRCGGFLPRPGSFSWFASTGNNPKDPYTGQVVRGRSVVCTKCGLYYAQVRCVRDDFPTATGGEE